MLLHMLNQSPQNTATSDSWLRAMSNGDTLLLLEDGVYYATPLHAEKLLSQLSNITVVALHTDVAARGIQALLHPSILVISDDEWVKLTCVAHSVCNWNG